MLKNRTDKGEPRTPKPCNRPPSQNKQLELAINSKELERLAIGGRLYDMLYWGARSSIKIINSDKETKDIIIKESDLLKLIQLVNPIQPDRNIKVIRD